MVTSILALLVAIAPLITAVGLKLIDIFVSDQTANAQAKTDFLNAIQAHSNDALQSVSSHDSDEQQITDFKNIPPVEEKKT